MVHETTMVDHGIVICLFLYMSSCMAIHSRHHDLQYQAKRARGTVGEISNALNQSAVDDEVDEGVYDGKRLENIIKAYGKHYLRCSPLYWC